ncbi:uncharacterized protein METZ01_LOCUS346274, partial [marine metagenome]
MQVNAQSALASEDLPSDGQLRSMQCGCATKYISSAPTGGILLSTTSPASRLACQLIANSLSTLRGGSKQTLIYQP